jgi:ActR/RegA family two-component response regulator
VLSSLNSGGRVEYLRENIEMIMVEQLGSTRRLLVLDDENDVAATICMMAATVAYETDHTDDADIFLEKVIAWAPTHVAVDLQLADPDRRG